MDTIWRIFSSYLPTIRDDGREYELPVYGSSIRSRPQGQKHDRPRSVPHVREVRARWKQQDEEEMKDLKLVTQPAQVQPAADEETRKRRWSVAEDSDTTNVKLPPSTVLQLEKAPEPEQAQVLQATSPISTTKTPTHRQRHERRRSSKLYDETTARSNETQSTTTSARTIILQRQLEQLQADLLSTKLELDHQRSVNAHLLTQQNQTEAELVQVTTMCNTQAGELLSLRAALADRALTERTPDARDEELATLKAFLSKMDNFSGAQILQSVQDMNTEIVQLAAAVSEEFSLARGESPSCTAGQCDIIRAALGDNMLALLRDSDHEEDPILVQLAVQAWEVRCCQDILDAFCIGMAPEVDRFLCGLFEEMRAAEPQATTSRWRALTHLHARNLMTRLASIPPDGLPPSAASTPSSCISPLPVLHNAAYPTPESSNNNTPASQILALPAVSLTLTAPVAPAISANLNGMLAILALAGCTDERGTSAGLLAERFGDAIARIGEAAETLARAVREGVSSAWFSVRVTPPARPFDRAGMENMYAGFGDETADVLCTVGLGLEVVRRVESGTADSDHNENGLQRTLLLKPKVILEGVQELL